MLALLGGIVVGLSIVASDNRPVVMPFDPMDRMTESSTSFLAVNVHIGHYAPDIEIPIAVRPCRYYLIFGGCGASLGSYSGSLLGLQIVGLMLVGFLFAILGVLGLFWSLNDRYRDRKAVGFALAAACLPACLFFYAWGLYGHPGAIIGLGMGR